MRRLMFIVATFVMGLNLAAAQPYPSRPITLVVPYPAGGPTDTLARIVAEPLRAALGQPVIVENIAGAGGAVGSARVARAPADGYTLIVGHLATHVILPATQTVNYDVIADFEPIALLADTPQGIAGRRTLPANNLQELIAWLKTNPGKTTMGSIGTGGPSDISAIQFQKITGTSVQLVPYRGAAPLLQDLIGGQIDTGFFQATAFIEQARGGQLKAFAVTSRKRMAAAPDVPTLDEAGAPGFQSSIWHGLWAPKSTPQDIVARLNSAMTQVLADAAVMKRFADIGQDIWPREQRTPQALAAHQKAEIEKWWPVIKAGNIVTRQ